MANKKKKSVARNLFKSSKKKLTIESVKNLYPEDVETKNSKLSAAIKGKSNKAIKQAVRNAHKNSLSSDERKGLDNKKSPIHAALTGTPQKAIKALVQEPFRLAEEKQNSLNKYYRQERSKLLRRIAYFKKQGYEFDADAIAPPVDGKATDQQVQRMRELRGKKLRNMAISYTPVQKKTESENISIDSAQTVTTDATTDADIADAFLDDSDQIGIDYTDDMFENDPNNFVDEAFNPTFDDLVYNEPDFSIPEYDEKETPQERYYKENPDIKFDGTDSRIDSGKTILQNAWSMINEEHLYLDTLPMNARNKDIKESAVEALTELLSKAEDALGQDALALILEKHAAEFNKAVERALKWRDSHDPDLTRSETSYALTQINNILFASDPALLTENVTGNPEDV